MFRFTIRELVLVTVIVAIGLGWLARESRLDSEIKRLRRWRMAAGALEDILTEDGWTVEWGHPRNQVLLIKSANKSQYRGAALVHTSRSVTKYEPSSNEP